jgi:hypothetical protein
MNGMGLKNEFWRILPEGNEWDGEINPLAYYPGWSQRKCDIKMEKGDQSKDRIFLEGLSRDISGQRNSIITSYNSSCRINGNRIG